MLRKRYEVVALAVLMAGCATSSEVKIPAHHADRPQAYRDGYVDGCGSGQGKTTQTKDVERIKKESLYANGWYDGYEECKANQRSPIRDAARK